MNLRLIIKNGDYMVESLSDALSNVNNADQFLEIIGEGKGKGLKAEIGVFGGRRFSCEGYNGTVSLSDIISCADKVLQQNKNPDDSQKIAKQIRQLDWEANSLLEKSGGFKKFVHGQYQDYKMEHSKKGELLKEFKPLPEDAQAYKHTFSVCKSYLAIAMKTVALDTSNKTYDEKLKAAYKNMLEERGVRPETSKYALERLDEAMNRSNNKIFSKNLINNVSVSTNALLNLNDKEAKTLQSRLEKIANAFSSDAPRKEYEENLVKNLKEEIQKFAKEKHFYDVNTKTDLDDVFDKALGHVKEEEQRHFNFEQT